MTLFRFFLTLSTFGRVRMRVVSNGRVVLDGFDRRGIMHGINVSPHRNNLVYKWCVLSEDGTTVIEAHI